MVTPPFCGYAQGQFNGEAFIQMDSETAAYQSAQQKHHKNMMFGKKQRYIEVFQCSGDDMNMVLNGGYQQPTNISKPPLLSPGMLPSAQQPPSQNPQTLALSQLPLSVPPPLTLSIPPPTPQLIAQQQAHFIAQQSLMARQAAAAAAANAHHQEQYIYQHLAMHPAHSTGANSAVVSQAPPTYATANSVSHQAGNYHMAHTHAPPPSMSSVSQAGIPSHLAAAQGAQYPQFVFMPRHMMGPGGFPAFGFMPPGMNQLHFPGAATAAGATGGLAQTPTGMAHHGSLSHSATAQQQHAAAMTANAAAAQVAAANSMLPASIKRSYDNAFRNDQSQLATSTGSKRPFHGGNQAAAAAAATAALYAPYYHPHI